MRESRVIFISRAILVLREFDLQNTIRNMLNLVRILRLRGGIGQELTASNGNRDDISLLMYLRKIMAARNQRSLNAMVLFVLLFVRLFIAGEEIINTTLITCAAFWQKRTKLHYYNRDIKVINQMLIFYRVVSKISDLHTYLRITRGLYQSKCFFDMSKWRRSLRNIFFDVINELVAFREKIMSAAERKWA